MAHPTFDKLPKRLTISFPLWLIYATKGEYSPYYDIDKLMKEHAERGFNCIRIDSGAGLIHDLSGKPRGDFDLGTMFGEFERIPRQQGFLGDGGHVDLLSRLIKTFECAKKYNMYVILSQWYFLHTYWFHKEGDPIADEIFAIPAHERFAAFAKFWHYILIELEKRGLDDRIVFVELFNEVNDHPYQCGVTGWDHDIKRKVGAEETEQFRQEHKEAIDFLRERHPQTLFGYDSDNAGMTATCMPENVDVFNFHAYFLWDIYDRAYAGHPEWFKGEITREIVETSRAGRRPASDDWYIRIARHTDIDYTYLDEIEKELEKVFIENRNHYIGLMRSALNNNVKAANGRPIVCGEGVSYICSKLILWEEHSESYWELIREMLETYKAAGIWGSVIRTCMGPEDPCWELNKDKILELNKFFLED